MWKKQTTTLIKWSWEETLIFSLGYVQRLRGLSWCLKNGRMYSVLNSVAIHWDGKMKMFPFSNRKFSAIVLSMSTWLFCKDPKMLTLSGQFCGIHAPLCQRSWHFSGCCMSSCHLWDLPQHASPPPDSGMITFVYLVRPVLPSPPPQTLTSPNKYLKQRPEGGNRYDGVF